jgi:hypothetical protein
LFESQGTQSGLRYGQLFAQLSRRQVFFLAAVLSGLLSRIGILWPGYTSDDYYYALAQPDYSWRSIHQGRFFAPYVSKLLVDSGFSQPGIQLPLFLLSLFFLAALVSKAMDLSLLPQRGKLLGAAAAAVCAAYPYLSSYYLFRMVILDQIIVYMIVLWALMLVSTTRWRFGPKVVLTSLLVGLGCGQNQLVFILYAIIALAYMARQFIEYIAASEGGARRMGRLELKQLSLVPATLFGALLIYFPLIKLVQHVTGISGEKSYSLMQGNGPLSIFGADLNLIADMMGRAEPIMPLYMKVLLLVAIALVLAIAASRSLLATAAIIAYGVVGLAIGAAPLAVGSGGQVARILMGAGFAIALVLSLGANFVDRPKWPAILLAMLTLLYAGAGATMFFQQHLLANWDRQKAYNIYLDASREFELTPKTRMNLINGSRVVGAGLSTEQGNDYGVNESVLRSDWDYAYSGLFRVSTGYILDVRSGPPAACAGKPRWPRSGAIFSPSKDVVDVCL